MTRDTNGRFQKGGPGGPGRKPRRMEQKYDEVLKSVVTPEAWAVVLQKVLELAKAGDAKMIRLLAEELRTESPNDGTDEETPSRPLNMAAIRRNVIGNLSRMIAKQRRGETSPEEDALIDSAKFNTCIGPEGFAEAKRASMIHGGTGESADLLTATEC